MIKKLFTGIVMILLLLPVTVGILHKNQFYAIHENRMKHSWPDGNFAEFFLDSGDYASQIGNYFNDRFAFRDLMIRIKNEMNYRIYHIADGTARLYISKDGYMEEEGIFTAQAESENFSDDDIEGLKNTVMDIKSYLKAHGADFYFMIAPQKNEVFPEWYTDVPVCRPDENIYQKVCRIFRNDEDIKDSFVDVLPVLREAQSEYPVYYKTDFHWNSYGAASAFKQVIERIALSHGIQLDMKERFSVYTDRFLGGLVLNHFPAFSDWSEEGIFTRPVSSSPFTESDSESETESPNHAYHWINSKEDCQLGRLLLIGDSYTAYMIWGNSGILDDFSEVYFVDINDQNFDSCIVNYASLADYVVFERIENLLPDIEKMLGQMMKEAPGMYSGNEN